MNKRTSLPQRVPQKARWIHLIRIGAMALMIFSLMGMVLSATAQPPPPSDRGVNGLIEHACPDVHETDDLQTDAGLITANTPQARSFDGNTNRGVDDKDWVRFEVVGSGVYTLTTYNLSALNDTFIKLYDASGDPVFDSALPVEDDDSGPGSGGSQIVWSAPSSAVGSYYLSIYPVGTTAFEDCVGTVVSYTLSLESEVPESEVPMFIYIPFVTRNN